MRSRGYSQMSVTTATGLSAPSGANAALIVVESGAIRYRDDGTNPTATVGTPLTAGQSLSQDSDISNFKMVSQSGTSIVSVNFYQP